MEVEGFLTAVVVFPREEEIYARTLAKACSGVSFCGSCFGLTGNLAEGGTDVVGFLAATTGVNAFEGEGRAGVVLCGIVNASGDVGNPTSPPTLARASSRAFSTL